MKLALVLMFTNELPYLKLHLPVFKDSFDGIVSITDPNTTDGSIEYIHEVSGIVPLSCPWRYNWGDFATRVFNYAETLGFDAAMRVDPDECLMPSAGYLIKRLLEREASLLVFPRHEFFGDRWHVRGDIYPDYQARAWRLGRGILVGGEKHEGVNFMQHGLSEHTFDPDRHVMRVSDPHIFHYGWIGKQGIWRNMVKYQSQAQVALGQPKEVNFPPDQRLAHHPTILFNDDQPLDPEVVGIYAPYKE